MAISPYSSNYFVFLMHADCVLSEVRTECLMQSSFNFQVFSGAHGKGAVLMHRDIATALDQS